MLTTRATLRRLRLPLPPPLCGSILARQLHATARRHWETGRPRYSTELPAVKVHYDFFPITLHYYSWRGPTMALHGGRMAPGPDELTSHLDAIEQDMRSGRDVVRVQEDGLVHPSPQGNDRVWNGAMLFPLAPGLFEFTDNDYEFYEEQKAAGRLVSEPYFLTIPKGVRMPNTLFLEQACAEMFYLMPRTAMPLSALNQELNNLFSSSGCLKFPYLEWFGRYKFVDAFRKDWMAE